MEPQQKRVSLVYFWVGSSIFMIAKQSRFHGIEGIKVEALAKIVPRSELPNPGMPISIIIGQSVSSRNHFCSNIIRPLLIVYTWLLIPHAGLHQISFEIMVFLPFMNISILGTVLHTNLQIPRTKILQPLGLLDMPLGCHCPADRYQPG